MRKSLLLLGSCLLLLLYVPCLADAQQFDIRELMAGNVPAYTVRSGHPRLYITPDNKSTIIQRITQSALGRETFQPVINNADSAMDTDFTAIEDGNGRNVYPQFLPYIEAFGLIHQLFHKSLQLVLSSS